MTLTVKCPHTENELIPTAAGHIGKWGLFQSYSTGKTRDVKFVNQGNMVNNAVTQH